MKKWIVMILMALLFAPPALILADDAAGAAPELPKTEDLKEAAPEAGENDKGDVEVPTAEPEVKKEAVGVVHKKPGHFRWGNFFMGALGGAALVLAVGIPAGGAAGPDGTGTDSSKIAVLAGAGALGGGLLSVLLGATSPLPYVPPDLSAMPRRPYQASAKQLVFTIRF